MTHHEELGNEHRELLKQLELAKQFKEKKRKLHKANRASDMARFEFQNAIGLVNQLEKKLWNTLIRKPYFNYRFLKSTSSILKN